MTDCNRPNRPPFMPDKGSRAGLHPDVRRNFCYRESSSKKRALNAVGKFASGISDISERHDDYLSEAYGDWR